MLLFRPPLMRFGRPGVMPANFAAAGDEPSPLDNDLPSLTDRAQSEWLWVLLLPLAASGTTEVNDAGGYALVGPADGTYTQAYRGLVMPLAGSPQVYESTITTEVGGGASPIVIATGRADETDVALALSLAPAGSVVIAVGMAVETDTAMALTLAATGPATISVGLAVETDVALGLRFASALAALGSLAGSEYRRGPVRTSTRPTSYR